MLANKCNVCFHCCRQWKTARCRLVVPDSAGTWHVARSMLSVGNRNRKLERFSHYQMLAFNFFSYFFFHVAQMLCIHSKKLRYGWLTHLLYFHVQKYNNKLLSWKNDRRKKHDRSWLHMIQIRGGRSNSQKGLICANNFLLLQSRDTHFVEQTHCVRVLAQKCIVWGTDVYCKSTWEVLPVCQLKHNGWQGLVMSWSRFFVYSYSNNKAHVLHCNSLFLVSAGFQHSVLCLLISVLKVFCPTRCHICAMITHYSLSFILVWLSFIQSFFI